MYQTWAYKFGALLVAATLSAQSAVSTDAGSSRNGVAPPSHVHPLTIQLHGLRNSRGQLLVVLFEKAQGFPDESDKAKVARVLPVDGMQPTVFMDDLVPGVYAVCVVHDENTNRRMDKNFLGIPLEGFGTSNNVKPRFGPPSFTKATFHYTGTPLTLSISMIYF